MNDAIYARQSVERVDSISIESQLEHCKYEARGNPSKEYVDRGYSGKNTHRPAFEAMLEDIRQGKVARVIVYKLDRISRSILDFANMMETFQQYHVEFISSTERFDTSSPIGRAMLNICIVFAQLERETIQKRVADAYYSRCKRGFYMGGRIPYGYAKENTVIDGVKTSMYVPVPEEAEHIRLMYSMYAKPGTSLGDIVAYFNEQGIRQLRGGMWSTARISEMLRNPVYVRADADVYSFFRAQGASIVNPVSDFTGHNACYLFKGTVSKTRKQCDLQDKEIVLAPHRGIVSSRDWLKCRVRCLQNRQSATTCKARNSWLAGKVKCGKCGYGLTIAKANTRWHRYFVCATALATKKSACHGTGGTVYATLLEGYVSRAIRDKLTALGPLTREVHRQADPRINAHKIAIGEAEGEIEDLMAKVPGANDTLIRYINRRVEALDAEKKRLQAEMLAYASEKEGPGIEVVSNHVAQWDKAAFADKQLVADALIKVITVAGGSIDITWNI